jgi:hypothetical protein
MLVSSNRSDSYLLDLRFSEWRLWRVWSSGLQCHAVGKSPPMFLWKVSRLLPNYMAIKPGRLHSSNSHLLTQRVSTELRKTPSLPQLIITTRPLSLGICCRRNCRCSTLSHEKHNLRRQWRLSSHKYKPKEQESLGLGQCPQKKIYHPTQKCCDSETHIKSFSRKVFPHFMFNLNDSKSINNFGV